VAKTKTLKTAVDTNVITMKVTLAGVRPPIWRRLVVPGSMTLGDLHQAILGAMGWHGGHLHTFHVGGKTYGDPSDVDDVNDEESVTLNRLLRSRVKRFTHTYDFGDDWQHTVAIEKSEPAVEGISYPVCVGGKRNCPPEDCGGVWGYGDLLTILADPAHPGHADQVDWLEGGGFDPEEFSIERTNTRLAARFRGGCVLVKPGSPVE
jgi:hypothetical protein